MARIQLAGRRGGGRPRLPASFDIGRLGAAVLFAAACDRTPGVARLYACEHSDLARPALVVARTPEEWRALWPRIGHCGGGTPPRVDFARQAVLVAAYGEVGSTGYAITIDSVTRRGDTTRVYARRVSPRVGCNVGPMVTLPLAAATAALAPGPVMLVTREVERESC